MIKATEYTLRTWNHQTALDVLFGHKLGVSMDIFLSRFLCVWLASGDTIITVYLKYT